MLRRPAHRFSALAATAALLGALFMFGAPSPAQAVPDTIPLNITNNSGRGEPVYVYNLGTLLTTGQQGWADANGTFHAWPARATRVPARALGLLSAARLRGCTAFASSTRN
ncbi:hypothetical protein ACWD1Y_44240, partial [Streptomyces sp. NPDC002814]